MQIKRFPSLNETQFLGCTSAFVDGLFGSLNSAIIYLRKLEGRPKGAAFAFEMQLDSHRYGALLILDRWSDFVRAFGPHLRGGQQHTIVEAAPDRVQSAENILGRANQVLDAAAHYSSDVVAACIMAFQSLSLTFEEERKAGEKMASLGPMLSEEYHDARRIFSSDLAAR